MATVPAISEEPGLNSRLDPCRQQYSGEITTEAHNAHRKAIAAVYREQLNGHPTVRVPAARMSAEPVFHQFVVKPAHQRDAVRTRLSELAGTLLHYPQAAHQMPAYRGKSWVE